MKSHRGYSLIELLVALVSSSVLMLILINQYMSVKQHYKTIQKNLEIALDGQLLVDLIRNTVWQAGFTPCVSIDRLISRDSRDPLHKIRSVDVNADKLGHGFQVNHMSYQYNILINQISLTEWTSTRDFVLTRQRPVLIADCHHAEVHALRSVRNRSDSLEISLDKPLRYTYEPPIYIGEWVEEHFFVRSGTLYYQSSHAEAISDSVLDMSVSFKGQHGKKLLRILLSLNNNQSVFIDTALRTL